MNKLGRLDRLSLVLLCILVMLGMLAAVVSCAPAETTASGGSPLIESFDTNLKTWEDPNHPGVVCYFYQNYSQLAISCVDTNR